MARLSIMWVASLRFWGVIFWGSSLVSHGENLKRFKRLSSFDTLSLTPLGIFPGNVFLNLLQYKIHPSYCIIYSWVSRVSIIARLPELLCHLYHFLASPMFCGRLLKLIGSQLPHSQNKHTNKTYLLVLCALNLLIFVICGI